VLKTLFSSLDKELLGEMVEGTILNNSDFVNDKTIKEIKGLMSGILKLDECSNDKHQSTKYIVNYDALCRLLSQYSTLSGSISTCDFEVQSYIQHTIGIFKFRNFDLIDKDLSYSIRGKSLEEMDDDVFSNFASMLYLLNGKFKFSFGESAMIYDECPPKTDDLCVNLSSISVDSWSSVLVSVILQDEEGPRLGTGSSIVLNSPKNRSSESTTRGFSTSNIARPHTWRFYYRSHFPRIIL